MESQIKIGERTIKAGNDPYIVGEVGINHNGEIDRALEMIHVAKKAGCDAVKFQTFVADEVCNDSTQTYTYRSQGKEKTESMLDMFKRYELPREAWKTIKGECRKVGIDFFSTPQNQTDLNLLMEVGVPAIKVGSDDFTNLPLLRTYSSTGLPLILSTGMSDLAEAHQALETVGGFDGYPVILLLCTSQYPTPHEDTNLARIKTLSSAFPNTPIGFSDHTRGPLASSLATALGAVFLEKHFTLNNDLPGPDHWFSEDPEGLSEWVKHIRASFTMIGSPIVRPTKSERKNKSEYQRRLVAAKEISQGELFSVESVVMRRVCGGKGFLPSFLDSLLGKSAPRDYNIGEPIDF